MFLLAVPMYAAPFLIMSLICFVVFLWVPRLRRFAVAALVAPVAFGLSAITGFISWVVVGEYLLKIDLRAVSGLRGILQGGVFFVLPGVLGSGAAVWTANKLLYLWRRLPIVPSWRERTSSPLTDRI